MNNLHTGSQEKEVALLVFITGPYRLGINLAKVREITRILPLKKVPYSHPVIKGVFELRQQLIPTVNLRAWLKISSPYPEQAKIIIARFLGLTIGFLVDRVVGIQRLSWSDINPPGQLQRLSPDVLGTVNIDSPEKEGSQSIITLIDYERIVLTVNPDLILASTSAQKRSQHLKEKRKTKSIWIIEDSRTVRDFLLHHLQENDYIGILFFENGKHALEMLESLKQKRRRRPDTSNQVEKPIHEVIYEQVDIIISDIEMPVMDAYTFIKQVKQDETFKKIPIILFSSLISAEHKLKGELAEADAQLSKSESDNLVPLLDRLLFS